MHLVNNAPSSSIYFIQTKELKRKTLPAKRMNAEQSILLGDAHLVPFAAEVLDCFIHLRQASTPSSKHHTIKQNLQEQTC